jgi:hypothetical protein
VLPQLAAAAGAAVLLAVLLRSRPKPEARMPRTSEARWTEQQKLAATDPELRPKLVRILAELRARFGADNVKLFYTYRYPETQAQLAAIGTGARQSKHTATRDGQPAARAADIVHAVDGWEGPRAAQLFAALGPLAEAEGLRWGGRWSNPYDPAHVELPGR